MTTSNETPKSNEMSEKDKDILLTIPIAGIVGYIAHKVVSHPNALVTKELMYDAGFKATDVHKKFTRFSSINVHPMDKALVTRYLSYNRLGWYTMLGATLAQQDKYDTFERLTDDNAKFIESVGIVGLLTGCVRNGTYSNKLLNNMGNAANGTSRSLTVNGVMFRGGMLGISSLLMFNFLLG